jgi:hypothetical protein
VKRKANQPRECFFEAKSCFELEAEVDEFGGMEAILAGLNVMERILASGKGHETLTEMEELDEDGV